MNEQEKSLKLAELMGWVYLSNGDYWRTADTAEASLCPYDDDTIGRNQFAAILLKFPEVIFNFAMKGDSKYKEWNKKDEPTQKNILDEILRMNGVDV